jgi:hypothetical protein
MDIKAFKSDPEFIEIKRAMITVVGAQLSVAKVTGMSDTDTAKAVIDPMLDMLFQLTNELQEQAEKEVRVLERIVKRMTGLSHSQLKMLVAAEMELAKASR